MKTNLLNVISSKGSGLLTTVSRGLHNTGFKIQKYSPEILAVAGVVGIVTSTVMACKATTKIDSVVDETKDKVDTIHKGVEAGEVMSYNNEGELVKVAYSQEDANKDLFITYVQSGVKFAKLYGPAVILGTLSIGCMLTSNNILRKRNIALAAAYTTIDQGFKEYRGRVIERFGEELDHELKYNIKAKEVEETVINEDGTEQVVTRTVKTADVNKGSQYARFFDEYSIGWTKNPEMNLYYVRQQQNFANDLLQTRGHVFLNEIYDMFGWPRTTAGQEVGWLYDPKDPELQNFIDFGIYDLHDEQKRDFVNGRERSILLDFTPDGPIRFNI